MTFKIKIMETIKINVKEILLLKGVRDVDILVNKLTKKDLIILLFFVLDNSARVNDWTDLVNQGIREIKSNK